MDGLATGLLIASVVALGLSAGALWAEAAVLVPFWRGISPAAFLDWYEQHASLLLRFFGLLEVVSTALILLAASFAHFAAQPGAPLLIGSAFLTLGVLATFPLYFKRANASFAERTIAVDTLAAELSRWARWHRARTVAAVLAFALATAALRA